MIIYNITLVATLDIYNEVKYWIKSEHLPEMMESEHLLDSKVFKLLNVDAQDGLTLCIQYHFENIGDYNMFKALNDIQFKNDILAKFSDKIVMFTSVLSEE